MRMGQGWERMIRGFRISIALLIAGAVALGVYRYGYERCRCKSYEAEIDQETHRLFDLAPQPAVRIAARRNVNTMSRCTSAFPQEISFSMLLAANLRMLGRNADAIAEYKRALSFDRRPELFYSLAETQLEAGDIEHGLENLVTAGLVFPSVLDDVGEPYRSNVSAHIQPIYEAINRNAATPELLRYLCERVAHPPP